MKGLAKWSGTVLFVLIIPFHLCAQQPLWRLDLRDAGYQFEEAETSIKFYGPYLMVYSGSIDSGSMRRRLVFEKENGRLVPQSQLAGVFLPLWDECGRTLVKKAFPEVNVIDCRNQMKLEQVGGIGRGAQKGDSTYYLQEPGKEKVLLFRGHCNAIGPRFVGDNYILLNRCGARNVVVDKRGQKLYEMLRLVDPYIATNREGTRFVVYERDSSFLGQFNDTSDKKRIKVFRSSDGKKLLEYRWGLVDGDRLNDGRVALSDDGSLAALIHGREVMVFVVPLKK